MTRDSRRLFLLGFSFLMTFLGLITPSHSQPPASFVMMKELSPWMPGKPEKWRQFLVLQDGSGQVADIVGNKVVSLATISYPHDGPDPLNTTALLALHDKYDPPPTTGLIVEGRGSKVAVVVQAHGGRKFISGDREWLPQAILDFRNKIPAVAPGQTGSYVSAGLLSEPASADLRNVPGLPSATPALLQAYPGLKAALASPFLLVALAPEQWQGLLAALKLSPNAAFLKTDAGDIVRLEFFQ